MAGEDLPDVDDVDSGEEAVGPVDDDPDRVGSGGGGGDQLAFVDPGTVSQSEPDRATLQGSQFGQRVVRHPPRSCIAAAGTLTLRLVTI